MPVSNKIVTQTKTIAKQLYLATFYNVTRRITKNLSPMTMVFVSIVNKNNH